MALDALSEASCVLFLCSGNVVRSAFAELYARHRGIALTVQSAATRFHNDGVFPETRAALIERGVDRRWIDDFRSTHLDLIREKLRPGCVVFGMRRHHLSPLTGHPVVGGSLHLLPELLGEAGEIADPVLEGADFGQTFARIARCVDVLIERQ